MERLTKHGGARPKRRNTDQRGGARPGSGPIQVRLRIGKVAGQELRILTLARRALTGNQAITPDDVAAQIIHAAWLEYDAANQENEHGLD